jgi:hypothetical protein
MTPKQVTDGIFERFLERPMPAMLTSEIIKKLDAAGYAIVPKEATQAQLNAVTSSEGYEPFTDKTMTEIYREMIAAYNT